jgi:5-formyltetrahydrofolate cyclo-ligase
MLPEMTIGAASRKAGLRAEALRRRGALSPSARESFPLRLAELGLAIARRAHAEVVSVFLPIGDEPDTLPLIAALAANGFRTALPVTMPRPAPLVFRAWRPGDPTLPGVLQIREPLASAEVVEPDLLFVPLACFDRRGHRIGFGAGHYDRTLAALRAARPVTAVGVAYSVSEAAAIPEEPYDQRLDFVLTEGELIDCRGG